MSNTYAKFEVTEDIEVITQITCDNCKKPIPPNLVKYIPKDNSIEVRCIFCGGKDESQETN